MSAPKFLESYPHFELCNLCNHCINNGGLPVTLGEKPNKENVNLRQRIYTWRKQVHRWAQTTSEEDQRLNGVENIRRWMGISISLFDIGSGNSVLTLKHETSNEASGIYSDVIAMFGNTDDEDRRIAAIAAANTPPQPAFEPPPRELSERERLGCIFPQEPPRPGIEFNRDSTQRITPALANMARTLNKGDGRPNDDSMIFWYPGYGNMGATPSLQIHLLRKWKLPLVEDHEQFKLLQATWRDWRDIEVIEWVAE